MAGIVGWRATHELTSSGDKEFEDVLIGWSVKTFDPF